MPTTEQINALLSLHTMLNDNRQWLTALTVVMLVLGGGLLVMTGLDWNRRRWGSLVPTALIICGAIALAASFVMYSAFGILTALEYDVPLTIWRSTEFAAELEAAKQMTAEISGWSVIGLTLGFLYVMLGGAALIKNWFLRKQQARGSMSAAPSNDTVF